MGNINYVNISTLWSNYLVNVARKLNVYFHMMVEHIKRIHTGKLSNCIAITITIGGLTLLVPINHVLTYK